MHNLNENDWLQLPAEVYCYPCEREIHFHRLNSGRVEVLSGLIDRSACYGLFGAWNLFNGNYFDGKPGQLDENIRKMFKLL